MKENKNPQEIVMSVERYYELLALAAPAVRKQGEYSAYSKVTRHVRKFNVDQRERRQAQVEHLTKMKRQARLLMRKVVATRRGQPIDPNLVSECRLVLEEHIYRALPIGWTDQINIAVKKVDKFYAEIKIIEPKSMISEWPDLYWKITQGKVKLLLVPKSMWNEVSPFRGIEYTPPVKMPVPPATAMISIR